MEGSNDQGNIWILGINPCINGMNYHDPSAVLLKNNKIICAVEEERFTGIKSSPGVFPINAIKCCLKIAKIEIEDINSITVGYEPSLWSDRIGLESFRTLFNSGLLSIIEKSTKGRITPSKVVSQSILESISELGNILKNADYFNHSLKLSGTIINSIGANVDVKFFEHHLCHLASAFYPSGFSESLGIVIDGVGELASTSLWKINKNGFEKILELLMPNSLGYFYAISTGFLGFKPWEGEGKLMALAPYGKRNNKIIKELNKIININDPIYDVSDFVSQNLINGLALDVNKAILHMSIILSTPPRNPNGEMTQVYKDIAWAVQTYLELAVIKLIQYGINETGLRNVCAAGGVFLNCKMNMVIREMPEIENYYVQPIANDSGLSIGSVLLKTRKYYGGLENLGLGIEYLDEDIRKLLIEKRIKYTSTDNISEYAAKLLANHKIVFWFNGKMEFGKRALGYRSILADPRKSETADYINTFIKHRETWRPFACSILEECAELVLENFKKNQKAPYMVEAFKVKSEWVDRVPAIIHKADKSTRPQTVTRSSQPDFYNLIKEFYKITGVPLILNTSLNDKGQPLIMSPLEAIKFYFSSNADYLILGTYIIRK